MKLNMKIPTSALKYAGKYRFKKREKGVSSDSDDDDESSVGSDETDLGFAPHLESMTLTEGYGEDDMSDVLSYFFGEHEDMVGHEDDYDSYEVTVGDSSDDENYPELFDEDDYELDDEFLDETAVGEEEVGSWPEALQWEEHDMSFEDDLADILNEIDFEDDEVAVGSHGLLGFYADSEDLDDAVIFDDSSFAFRRRLLDLEDFEDVSSFTSFYDSEEAVGDFFDEERVGTETDVGEQRLIDALSDYLKKTDPEQWDVSDDDDEDEEELGDSESIEKQEKLPGLPNLKDFLDVENEAKLSDDGLVKTLKNFLDSNKASSQASDSSDFSNELSQDDSDEEQVGSMYSSEEMGLEPLPDLDEFISRFDSDSGETEVGDDDLLDALQSFLKAQGIDSSEETVADFDVNVLKKFINDESDESAVGDSYDEFEEVPVGRDMSEDEMLDLLEDYLSRQDSEEAVGEDDFESDMMP